MERRKPVRAVIPGLGMRSIKTAAAVAALALVYLPLDRNPTFACIGAVFGMGYDIKDSKESGGNRLFGTIIGGFIGLAMYWTEYRIFPEGNYYMKVLLAFIGSILLVSASVTCRWPGAVPPGGVVLFIIIFNTPANHIGYALARMLDTAIGVLFALFVNKFFDRRTFERFLGFKDGGSVGNNGSASEREGRLNCEAGVGDETGIGVEAESGGEVGEKANLTGRGI